MKDLHTAGTVQNVRVSGVYTTVSSARSFLWFSTILWLLSSVTAVTAATLDEVTIEDAVTESRDVVESLSIRLLDNEASSFELLLPATAHKVLLDGNPVETVNGTLSVPLSCEECLFTVEYELDDVIVPGAGVYLTLSRTLNLPEIPRLLKYRMLLPRGYGIGSANVLEMPVVPEPTSLETDGQRIIITWSERQPELPKRYFVSYRPLEHIRFTLRDILEELKEWPVLLFCALSLVLGFAGGWFLSSRRSRPAVLEVIPSSMLTPDELLLVEELRRNGTMRQKEIGKRLSWSKSKVSGIVTNLVQKRLLERTKIGRNYDVTLVQDVV